MIGVLVVTHGKLAEGLKDSIELIIGEQKKFEIEGLFHGDDFEELKTRVYDNVLSLNDSDGVLVLVDLFGASPYNSVVFNYPRFKQENIEVRLITGINLPMLIEALDARNYCGLDELYAKSLETAKEHIKGFDGHF